MKTVLSIISVCILFCISNCTNGPQRRKLSVIKKISHLSDSSFFTDIRCIEEVNYEYWISDYRRSQILQLDTNLVLRGVYGELGNGQGEMKGVSSFYIYEDTVFAISQAKKAIVLFKKGAKMPIKTLDIPQEIIGTRLEFRFFVTDKNILLSTPESGKIVTVLNRNGEVEKNIGEMRKFQLPLNSDLFETTSRNINWVFSGGSGKVITIADVLPELRILDFDGKVLLEQAFYGISTIDERTKYVHDQPAQEHVTYAFFEDVYFNGKFLYLLCISGETKKELRSNRIIVLEWTNGKFTFKEEVQLPGKWYNSFCVKENLILAFENTTGELQIAGL